jgi:hypothetical protein
LAHRAKIEEEMTKEWLLSLRSNYKRKDVESCTSHNSWKCYLELKFGIVAMIKIVTMINISRIINYASEMTKE